MENDGSPAKAEVMTPANWAITLFLMNLPFIGFILLLVWAFGGGVNPNKANFAKGALIIMLIFFVIGIFFWILFGTAIIALVSSGEFN